MSWPGWCSTPGGWSTDRGNRGPPDLDVARPARNRGRSHAFHAQTRARQGVGVLRPRRSPCRAALACRLPHPRGSTGRDTSMVRRAAVHLAGVRAQAGDGRVAQRVGGRIRPVSPRLPGHGHLLRGARCCALCRIGDPRQHANLQGSLASRRLRPQRSVARRRLGDDCRRRCASGHPLRFRAAARPFHGARADTCSAAPSSAVAAGDRAHGHAGIRRLHGHRRPIRAGSAGHHDGFHAVRRGDDAVPARRTGPAARTRRQDIVRQRLPQHPVLVRRRLAMQPTCLRSSPFAEIAFHVVLTRTFPRGMQFRRT